MYFNINFECQYSYYCNINWLIVLLTKDYCSYYKFFQYKSNRSTHIVEILTRTDRPKPLRLLKEKNPNSKTSQATLFNNISDTRLHKLTHALQHINCSKRFMSVYYISLFISLCFNACFSLYSRLSLILLNRVAWLVLLFGFFSLSNGNGFGLSVRVKISTIWLPLREAITCQEQVSYQEQDPTRQPWPQSNPPKYPPK